MPRTYDSSRRKRAAEQTRTRILEAALRLHWDGITEYEPLAREAGCSMPTLRKHFPTKESLFRSCTQVFSESLTLPDLEALGKITSTERRLEESVSENCRIHEVMFGYAWFSAHQRSESPTLDEVMTAYEGLADAMSEIITADDASKTPIVRGLLDFLTYRALRLSGGLSPAEVADQLTDTLRPLVVGEDSPSRPQNDQEFDDHDHQ